MKIGLGSDHGGFLLKEFIKEKLKSLNYELIDYGTKSSDSVDYPDFAYKVALGVLNKECERGIVICTTGIGVCIAANKIKGIRAALCWNVITARQAREHIDTNVLALGGGMIGNNLAWEIVKTWLGTNFVGEERHLRRIKKIEEIEKELN